MPSTRPIPHLVGRTKWTKKQTEEMAEMLFMREKTALRSGAEGRSGLARPGLGSVGARPGPAGAGEVLPDLCGLRAPRPSTAPSPMRNSPCGWCRSRKTARRTSMR